VFKYLNANTSSNMFSMSLTLICLMESFTLMHMLVIYYSMREINKILLNKYISNADIFITCVISLHSIVTELFLTIHLLSVMSCALFILYYIIMFMKISCMCLILNKLCSSSSFWKSGKKWNYLQDVKMTQVMNIENKFNNGLNICIIPYVYFQNQNKPSVTSVTQGK